MDPKLQQILVFALIGLVAGWLASFIVGGGNWVQYLISGLLGSFVGGYLFDVLGINLGLRNPLISQIITAAIGAIIVVFLARLILS